MKNVDTNDQNILRSSHTGRNYLRFWINADNRHRNYNLMLWSRLLPTWLALGYILHRREKFLFLFDWNDWSAVKFVAHCLICAQLNTYSRAPANSVFISLICVRRWPTEASPLKMSANVAKCYAAVCKSESNLCWGASLASCCLVWVSNPVLHRVSN